MKLAIATMLGLFAALSGSTHHAVTRSPTNVVNSGTGTAWTNPANTIAEDGNSATISLGSEGANQRLTATGFGFSIPANATNITVTLRVKGDSDSAANVSAIDLVLDGVVGDWWGTSGQLDGGWVPTFIDWQELTPADVNDPDFGAAFGVYDVTGGGSSVDAIQLTVEYDTP